MIQDDKEQIIKKYYPILEEMLLKLAETDYRTQNLSLSFPVGNISITIYSAASND